MPERRALGLLALLGGAQLGARAASRSATRGIERRGGRRVLLDQLAGARQLLLGVAQARGRGAALRAAASAAALDCVMRLRAASRSARACATRASKSARSSRTSGWFSRTRWFSSTSTSTTWPETRGERKTRCPSTKASSVRSRPRSATNQ